YYHRINRESRNELLTAQARKNWLGRERGGKQAQPLPILSEYLINHGTQIDINNLTIRKQHVILGI
ncbi:MAG: hypothetical protein WBW79_18950, partial [Desulfocapsaceae bacterium]